jgi:hypothetical protein
VVVVVESPVVVGSPVVSLVVVGVAVVVGSPVLLLDASVVVVLPVLPSLAPAGSSPQPRSTAVPRPRRRNSRRSSVAAAGVVERGAFGSVIFAQGTRSTFPSCIGSETCDACPAFADGEAARGAGPKLAEGPSDRV